MGNLCIKCLAYVKSEETRVFEPGKATLRENQRGNVVEVLSIRNTSINEGTLHRENSLQEFSQVQQGCHKESNSIDAIRIIGPSGEEEESFRISSVSEGASELQKEIEGQALMPGSSKDKNIEERHDDAGTTVIANGEIKNSNGWDSGNLKDKNDRNISEEFTCAVANEIQGRNINHNATNFIEQMAALVTKLAVAEVPRYYHKRKADYTRELKRQRKKGGTTHCQFKFPQNSKIHDYINGITRNIIQMSAIEVAKIKENKHGFLKSKTAEEKDLPVEFEERHKFTLGTLNVGYVYQAGNGTRCKNCNAMIGTERDSCATITSSGYSRSGKSIVARNDINGTRASSMSGAKASSMSGAVYKTYIRRDTTQKTAITPAERLAQPLVDKIVTEAMSEAYRTISFLFQKSESIYTTTRLVTFENMQSKHSQQCLHMWVEDHATKKTWPESTHGCSNIDFQKDNYLVKAKNKPLRHLKKTIVQSKIKESVPEYYAFSEQLSIIIIGSALSSLTLRYKKPESF